MRKREGEEAALLPFALAGSLLDGKYRVDRLVAEGGFGVVYAGHHVVLDVPIAVKVLKTTLGEAAEQNERFAREAQTIAKIKHPSIVQVLDAGIYRPAPGEPLGSVGPLAWMVLEWLTGQTLKANLVERRGRGGRTPLEAMTLLRPVLDAVGFAHSKQVVHRDLKPSNIMLTPAEGRTVVRVLDFGVAKVFDDEPVPDNDDTETRGPAHAFSRGYAAPEQLAGGRTGPWTDVHALGLLLTELLTDRAPYDSSDATELYELVFDARRPSPARSGVEVGAWQAIIERAVSLKPSRRFASVAAFAVALEQTIDEATRAFASSPPRDESVPKAEVASWFAGETTRSELTASNTFSVVSSERTPAARPKLPTWLSRRTMSRVSAVAAVTAGVVFASAALRSTPSTGSTAEPARPSGAPVEARDDATPSTGVEPAAEKPQGIPAPSTSLRKRPTPSAPARRAAPISADSASVAPSARPELPPYVVE